MEISLKPSVTRTVLIGAVFNQFFNCDFCFDFEIGFDFMYNCAENQADPLLNCKIITQIYVSICKDP